MLLKVGWFVALFSILFAGLSVAFATQQQIKKNVNQTKKVTATIAFADQNWAESKDCNLDIIKHDPKDQSAWFNLGLSQHYLGEYEEARKSFIQAIEYGFEPGINYYNIACTYARQENLPKVIEYAEKAQIHGFPVAKYSESDPDLAEVRTTEQFKEVLETEKKG